MLPAALLRRTTALVGGQGRALTRGFAAGDSLECFSSSCRYSRGVVRCGEQLHYIPCLVKILRWLSDHGPPKVNFWQDPLKPGNWKVSVVSEPCLSGRS